MNKRFVTQWTAGSMYTRGDVAVDAFEHNVNDQMSDVSKKASGNRRPVVG